MTSTDAARSRDDAPLLEERDGRVVWLRLNRKSAMNALDEPLLRALHDALARLAADPTVGALVLTGVGHRAFCFGADPATLDAGDAAARRARLAELLPVFQGIIRLLDRMPAPSLAALNGFATGAGFDLALACDLRIATRRAKLGSAFVGLGLVPDGGGTYHLPRLVGLGRALELTMLADAMDADTALGLGLLNRVVEPEALENTAGEIAARLAAAPRPAVERARALLRASCKGSLDDALVAEAAAQLECAGSEAFAAALDRTRRRQRR